MAVLNQAACQEAWNNLNINTSVADIETLFNQAGYQNDLNTIDSNMQSQGGAFDTFGAALITFKMTHWMHFLKKMHQITGDAIWMTRAEDLVDWMFARTDAQLWANDPATYSNLPVTGGGNLVPYTECAGLPLNWNINTPWCGWSRIFNVVLDGTNTTFVRAEPLLDGGIAEAILCVIKHMRECGTGASEAKISGWLSTLQCVMEGWKANWVEDRTITINPDCNPTGTPVVLAGQFYLSSNTCGQTFAEPIALNQAGTALAAMLLLNQCDSSMCVDAKAMSTRFIQDINNHYFNSSSGWYYRLSCAGFEPAEDLGHFYITSKFIHHAFDCGLVDQTFVDRFIDGLKANSYQGGGEWTWLNDGTYVNSGNQPNGQFTAAQGFASGPTDSAINGNSQLGKVISAIAALPGNADCIDEMAATAQLMESQGSLNNNERLEGMACLYVQSCEEETIQPTVCINCNTSTLPAQTFQTGTPHSFLINLQDTTGAPLTTAPIITPNTYINSVTNQDSGNFLVTVTVPTGQQGVYPLVINNGVAGCTDCQLVLNAQQTVIPVCTTTTATATVGSTGSTPCAITFSNPTPKAGETITATACNCAGYTFSNWTSTPAGAVINGNTATYTVPFGAVVGSTEQFNAVCCEV